MKLLSRSSYLFLGLLLIFLSSNAIAGICDDCADCINDIKGVISYTSQVQKIADKYQCFQVGDKYILNFTSEEIKFIANYSQPVVVKPQEGDIVEINNLKLGEAEGVDKDIFLKITGSNVSINSPTFTGGGVQITSSNVAISGGTVGGINIDSSASDVVISNTDISGNVTIAGKKHTITNSTAHSIIIEKDASNVSISGGTVGGITIDSSASDVVISSVDIASSAAVGIDVAGQRITITGPDFLGDIATPILLAEGANAGVKPPDIAKVFRKMSGDETVVKEVVGIVEGYGNVELFKLYGDVENKKNLLFEKKCAVFKKEDATYSQYTVIPEKSYIFICENLDNFKKDDFIVFTFTDSNDNTSILSDYIKLAEFDELNTSIPPITLPAPITPEVVESDDKKDETPGASGITVSDGGGTSGNSTSIVSGCNGSIAGNTSGSGSPFACLFILLSGLSTMIVHRFL